MRQKSKTTTTAAALAVAFRCCLVLFGPGASHHIDAAPVAVAPGLNNNGENIGQLPISLPGSEAQTMQLQGSGFGIAANGNQGPTSGLTPLNQMTQQQPNFQQMQQPNFQPQQPNGFNFEPQPQPPPPPGSEMQNQNPSFASTEAPTKLTPEATSQTDSKSIASGAPTSSSSTEPRMLASTRAPEEQPPSGSMSNPNLPFPPLGASPDGSEQATPSTQAPAGSPEVASGESSPGPQSDMSTAAIKTTTTASLQDSGASAESASSPPREELPVVDTQPNTTTTPAEGSSLANATETAPTTTIETPAPQANATTQPVTLSETQSATPSVQESAANTFTPAETAVVTAAPTTAPSSDSTASPTPESNQTATILASTKALEVPAVAFVTVPLPETPAESRPATSSPQHSAELNSLADAQSSKSNADSQPDAAASSSPPSSSSSSSSSSLASPASTETGDGSATNILGLTHCEMSFFMNTLLALGSAALLAVVAYVIYNKRYRSDRSRSYPFVGNSIASSDSAIRSVAANTMLLIENKPTSKPDANNNGSDDSPGLAFGSNARAPPSLSVHEGVTKL